METREGWRRVFAAAGLFAALCWPFAVRAGLESGATPGEAQVSPDGTAHLRVPLALTPGPGGLVPQLALEWSSARRGGLLGQGWDLLGLSSITRCARTTGQDGVAAAVSMTTGDTGDRYCLDGLRLRRVAGVQGAPGTVYQTESESFLRVTSQGAAGNGPAWFTVEQPDGTVLTYGGTADSRIEDASGQTVRVWALSSRRDRAGNTLRVTYQEDAGPALVTQGVYGGQYGYRPLEISYAAAGNGEPAHHAVRFIYEAAPQPIEAGWQAGTLVVSWQRLVRVEHRHDTALVRQWSLAAETAPAAWRVTECGPTRCREPLRALVTPAALAVAGLQQPGDLSGYPQADASLLADLNGDGREDFVSPTAVAGYWSFRLADPAQPSGFGPRVTTSVVPVQTDRTVIVDWDADGRKDLLYPVLGVNGTARWWWVRSTGTGLAAAVDTGYGVDSIGLRAVAVDVNGDGRDDLVYAVNSPARVMARLHDGTRPAAVPLQLWAMPTGQAFCAGSGLTARQPEIGAVDFDADGRADLLACTVPMSTGTSTSIGTSFGYSMNTLSSLQALAPAAGASTLRALLMRGTVAAPVAQWVADLGDTDGAVAPRIGDFNGDGYQDVLFRRPSGAWSTRAFTGHAFASAQAAPAPSSAALVFDLDGDGASDLLDARTDGWVFFAGQRGREALLASQAANVTGSEVMGSAYRVGDVDGDGTPDLFGIAMRDIGWHVVKRVGPAQARVSRVVEGAGAVVSWFYADSEGCVATTGLESMPVVAAGSGSLLRAAASGVPVCRQEVEDGLGTHATLRFRYGDPRRDVLRREWLGPAWREQKDERHGTVLREQFQQAFPLRGVLASRRVTGGTGQAVLQEELVYAVTQNGTGTEVRRWPQLQQKRRQDYVLGGVRAGAPQRSTVQSFGRDPYGGLIQQAVEVTDLDSLSPGFGEVHRQTLSRTYRHEPVGWCLRLPAREERVVTAPDGTRLVRVIEQDIDTAACRAVAWRELAADSSVLRSVAWSYDACGNRNATTLSPAGMAVRTVRQDFGSRCVAPATTTDALGQTTRLAWRDSLGVLATATDMNGEGWQADYDEFGRKVRWRAPDGSEWRAETQTCLSKSCAQLGSRWWQTERWTGADGTPLDEVTTYFGDRGQAMAEDRRGPLGPKVREVWNWNTDGQLAAFSLPAYVGLPAAQATLRYDTWGRVQSVQRPRSGADATPVTETFEFDGAITTATDVAGARTVFKRDVLGRLRVVVDPLGGTTTYTYGVAGLVRVVDAVGAVTRLEYDALGRQVALQDAQAGRREFTLNALGQVVSERDAKGQVRSYERDLLGRVVRRLQPEGETRWTWGTDGLRHEAGRLVAIDGPVTNERFAYDGFGRLLRRGWAGARGDAYDYTYDAAGRLEVLVYPPAADGTRLRVRHGWDGRQLLSLRDADSGQLFWQARAFDVGGLPIDELLGNGVVRSAARDAVTGLPDWRLARRADGSNLQDVRFTFDERGLLVRRLDAFASMDATFRHDLLGRLTAVAGPAAASLAVQYDAAGNVLQRSDVGVFRYDPAVPGRLLQAGTHTYSYDANGNVAVRDGASLSWNSNDQPAVLRANGLQSRYTYGPEGELVAQEALFASGTENTAYVGELVERVVTAAREHQRQVIVGPEGPVAWVVRRSDGTRDTWYATQDERGSLDTLTDAQGTVVSRLRYSPFGARASSVSGSSGGLQAQEQTAIAATTRRGFGMQVHADNLGLVHFGQRVLDPASGRFLSADPLVAQAGNSQDWNRYAYAWNSPYAVADPYGNTEVEIFVGTDGFGIRVGGGECTADGNADCSQFGFGVVPSGPDGRFFYDWDDPDFRQEVGPGFQLRFSGNDGTVGISERLDLLQGGLNAASAGADLTGIGEPLGVALDGLNGLVSLLRGEPREAAEQVVAMVPVAGTLKNFQLLRKIMDKLEARRAVAKATRHQEVNPRYGRADRWQTKVLEPGTVLLQFGRANDPGPYFFALSPAEARAAGAAALYDGLQMRTSDNHGRWTQVQVYRVTQPIGGAVSIAGSNLQHGKGGIEQYFLTRTEGLAHVGTIDLGR